MEFIEDLKEGFDSVDPTQNNGSQPLDPSKYSAFVKNPGDITEDVMYQLSDEYHLFYFGAGGIAGVEIPLAKRWTIILDGSFTLDYPNWGGNRLMLPFDWGWQWQTSLGVRYSKKLPNRFHLLP